EVGERAIARRRAGTGIDDEKNGIGLRHGRPGLGLHLGRKALALPFLEAGSVDHRERKVAELPGAFSPVPGHPWLVIHQRAARADKPVEQSRLAHIGPADNSDGERHDATCGHGQKHDVASVPGLLVQTINVNMYWAPGDWARSTASAAPFVGPEPPTAEPARPI